tara:strand:- start:135 stop:944 length:810 start_codon:yes stop_codon:yes gene_type:complete
VNKEFQLNDQVAVVTGARGKLGPVWVEALLDAGAHVAALDLPGTLPSSGFKALESRFGERLKCYDCDITNRESISSASSSLVNDFGEATILVNNAGVDQPPDSDGSRSVIHDLSIDQIRHMVEVNFLGTLQVIQIIGSKMVPLGTGSIINIGSVYASVSPDQRFYDHLSGNLPFLKSPAYGASKAGVVNLTKYFATLWGSKGVRVNTLSPGGVLGEQDTQFKEKYTSRVPLGRMAQTDDLKGPLIFLASRASAYVTGHDLAVDGGFTSW